MSSLGKNIDKPDPAVIDVRWRISTEICSFFLFSMPDTMGHSLIVNVRAHTKHKNMHTTMSTCDVINFKPEEIIGLTAVITYSYTTYSNFFVLSII